MTEAEWLACDGIPKLLKRSRAKSDGRKVRLLICAWCRRRWDVLDECYRHAVEIGERYADGFATDAEIEVARESARTGRQKIYGVYFAYARRIQFTDAASAANCLVHNPFELGDDGLARYRLGDAERAAEKRTQRTILRDIFGNPFRPVKLEPAWRTFTVTAMARQMYESRDFSAMPILADALQDAGCENDDILTHCRGPGPHVRGCWVVDLVLGKE